MAAWYSTDETVLNHGILCHKLDQEAQLGRLCTVEEAVYHERLQIPDNRQMLVFSISVQHTPTLPLFCWYLRDACGYSDGNGIQGSTALLRLLAPSLPSENTGCPIYDGINPCSINTTVRSVNFFGDYYIEPAPVQHLDMLCNDAQRLTMPTVFLVRDHSQMSQMSHLLTVQLAPLIEVTVFSFALLELALKCIAFANRPIVAAI